MKTARDVMTPDLLTVPPTMDLESLAQLFCRHGITGAPVVDEQGVVVGMVTQSDLTRARASGDDLVDLYLGADEADLLLEDLRDDEYATDPAEAWALAGGDPSGLVVGDVMTRRLHSIEPEATLPQVSRTMLELGVRRLVVVDEGRFLGIVTASDLVRAWTHQFDEVEASLRRLPMARGARRQAGSPAKVVPLRRTA